MSVIENAKEIASLVKKLGDIELYRKIVELEGEITDLTKEKRDLEEQLAQRNRSQEIIKTLHFASPFYVDAKGSEKYCLRCIESDERAIHVIDLGRPEFGKRTYVCPQCKSKYVPK